MQETYERMIPKIICTKVNFTDNCASNHHDEEIQCDRRLAVKARRIGRSRIRRNSRRLSITQDRQSSSSRSPSPSPIIQTNRLTSESATSVCYDSRSKYERSSVKVEGRERDENTIIQCDSPTSGYGEYLQLLEVPQSSFVSSLEWGEPSGDDLSSEWESDHSQSDCRNIFHDNVEQSFHKVPIPNRQWK